MARKAEDIVKDGEKTRFKPGQVTNPNGRPKGVPNAATRFERFLNLIQKGKNPVTKEDEEFTVAELMDLKQIAKALNGNTVAWDKINDRLEGKARQSTELSGKDGEPIQVEQTLIQIAFRPPQEAEPTASKKPTAPKGERKKG